MCSSTIRESSSHHGALCPLSAMSFTWDELPRALSLNPVFDAHDAQHCRDLATAVRPHCLNINLAARHVSTHGPQHHTRLLLQRPHHRPQYKLHSLQNRQLDPHQVFLRPTPQHGILGVTRNPGTLSIRTRIHLHSTVPYRTSP